jgi:hypothetical protein
MYRNDLLRKNKIAQPLTWYSHNSGAWWQFSVRSSAWVFVSAESDEARKSATVAIPGPLCGSLKTDIHYDR